MCYFNTFSFFLLPSQRYSCFSDRTETHLVDVVNMVNIPSKRKSDKLRLICAELNLCDPYRIFHPTRREYTFKPSAIGMLNRSRLDFFVITKELLIKFQIARSPTHSLALFLITSRSLCLQIVKSFLTNNRLVMLY